MSVNYNVPFFENTPDNTRCVQASYRMVLKYFLPEKDFSWDELDSITNKRPNLWTWPMAGLCWFSDNGFDVVYIEDFDYQTFMREPYVYMEEKAGAEVANEQRKHSDIEGEIEWTKKFLEKVNVQNYQPSLDEIKSYLDQGYIIVTSVNSLSLYNKPGYLGHSVVVRGYDDKHIILNDPGIIGREDIKIPNEQFIKGWSYPDSGVNNITAIKLA